MIKDYHRLYDFEPIEKVMQEHMPKISPGPVGRLRLLEALRGRFGENFKNLRVAQETLDHFDKESKMIKTVIEMRKRLAGEV